MAIQRVHDRSKRELAHRLRRDCTGPERRLWALLRSRRLGQLKFRRQVPIGPYVVDFYCAGRQLVIELDGKSHEDRLRQDINRQRWLESQRLRVLRFDNDDVLRDDEAVLKAVLIACGINPDV